MNLFMMTTLMTTSKLLKYHRNHQLNLKLNNLHHHHLFKLKPNQRRSTKNLEARAVAVLLHQVHHQVAVIKIIKKERKKIRKTKRIRKKRKRKKIRKTKKKKPRNPNKRKSKKKSQFIKIIPLKRRK